MGMTYWGKLPRVVVMLAALCLLASFAAAGTTKNTSSTSSKSTASSTSTKSKKKSKKSKKVRGQKAIDATRTKQIQQALIEQKYMRLFQHNSHGSFRGRKFPSGKSPS